MNPNHCTPQGCNQERENDETEIRHAVTVLLAEYPAFNQDGLQLHSRETRWQNPLDMPGFMTAAKSCMAWLRHHRLTDCQINSFPEDAPTSYALKHRVEQFNDRHCGENGKPTEPNYIPNGAMIVAMVANGYRINPVSKMNAGFNLSIRIFKKHLTNQ